MPYIVITRTPGVRLADYDRVLQDLGAQPIEGRLSNIVGEADGALTIVDVWESQAHADRFASERLFPAFERDGFRPGPDALFVAFQGEVSTGLSPAEV